MKKILRGIPFPSKEDETFNLPSELI